jgi:AcrR family transcriptional regulator
MAKILRRSPSRTARAAPPEVPKGRPRKGGRNLREDCVTQALAVIEEVGVEGLSLRDVARRLGVSHQAPYKHFASRDHLLAEVVARAFAAFAAHLDTHPPSADPHADLSRMGTAYIGYARAHPLNYRLMFGTPLPDPAAHPEMMRRARHAFGLLRACVGRLPGRAGPNDPLAAQDALFVWATVHGIASILETKASAGLDLPAGAMTTFGAHAFARLGQALAAPAPPLNSRVPKSAKSRAPAAR